MKNQNEEAKQTQGLINQLVTFKIGKEELAVPIRVVQEIIRVPEITRVPAAPGFVDGIGNLRGDLLPIINLRARLGMARNEMNEDTRVIVLKAVDSSIGLIIDSVSEVLTIDQEILERPPEAISGIEGQFLSSIAKVEEGKRLILILDEKSILPDVSWDNGSVNMTDEKQEIEVNQLQTQDTDQLVTFRVGEEEYAIDIMQVKEIIRVTEITPVPKAPPYICGVMSLRNNLLPIMDLRLRFNLEASDKVSSEHQRIVVVDLNGILTGIRVDAVSQVLTVEKSKIENPPSIVKTDETDCLRGVGKLENGKRILMLLDVVKLIHETDATAIQDVIENGGTQSSKDNREVHTDEAQLVCFRINAEEYALDIMKVQEIIRLREITTVPHSKSYMEGIINLRGTVVPVIDMRSRFGLVKSDRSEQNRIVIVNIHQKITGLIVDSVSEVIRMPKNLIEGAPETIADSRDEYIEGIGKLEEGKRILILIKTESLLDKNELSVA